MTSYLTATKRKEQTAMPEPHLFTRALEPNRVIDPSFAATPPFAAGWQLMDQIAQGVRIDRCGVTDVQNSTRTGPPPCSPPV